MRHTFAVYLFGLFSCLLLVYLISSPQRFGPILERAVMKPPRFVDQTASNKTFICVNGRVLPKLQVLGAQKAASTTLFRDLFSVIGKRTDLDCNNVDEAIYWRCKEPQVLFLIWKFKNVSEYGSLWGPCDSFRDAGVVADFSPDNLWPRYLPSRMSQAYGPATKEIVFVVSLREPKRRMLAAFANGIKSGWLYEGEKPPTFQEHVDSYFEATSRHNKIWVDEPRFRTVMQSLYYMNLRMWLTAPGYEAHQFIIFPGKVYLDHRDNMDTNPLLHAMRSRFGQHTLRPNVAIDSEGVENKGNHSTLQELLTSETIRRLDNEIFLPQNIFLAQLLAVSMTKGTVLVGYEGRPLDAVAVLAWLEKGWDF